MDSAGLRKYGGAMVDYVADYWQNIRERQPLPNVQPGDISSLLSEHPPTQTDTWETIFKDLNEVVMKGTTNWNHPNFFAYYPAACSYPSILGDILSTGLNIVGLSWKAGPALSELEMVVLDWLVDLLGLPEHFKNNQPGPGCSLIHSTASEATLTAILLARARMIEAIKNNPNLFASCIYQDKTVKEVLEKVRQNTFDQKETGIISHEWHDAIVFEKLIAYCSEQAHYSVEKAAMLCGVKLRKLKTDRDSLNNNYCVTKETLETAIREDRLRGLIPFIMVATVGTTDSCGFDRLDQLGPVCNKEHIYIHVDAAYAGSFLACPEFRYMSEGVELVDSFNFNAHNALLANFDCSPMWFKDGALAAKYFNVDAVYLMPEQRKFARDNSHLQIGLGRRFRALKIYFVLRHLGAEYVRKSLKQQVELAALFAKLIAEDEDFELFVPQHLGLVCFKTKKGSNEENAALCKAINDDRRIHLIQAKVHGLIILRLAICSQLTTEEDIKFAFNVCKEILAKLRKAS